VRQYLFEDRKIRNIVKQNDPEMKMARLVAAPL
jgi:hypothetical protein